MHVGDQNSTADLDRVYEEAGSRPFDIVVDDGSHRPAHQWKTLVHFLSHGRVAPGGVYVIEDIAGSCISWRGPSCLLDRDGNPTLFARLADWQRDLFHGAVPFPGV